MVHIGNPIPPFRALVLVQGELSWLNSWQLIAHQWTALCFVPHLNGAHQNLLTDYNRHFEETGTQLIIVAHDEAVLFNPRKTSTQRSRLIILDDPMHRLHRTFGAADRAPDRCTTFMIDPNGVLQIPLIHDLDGRGLDAVLELVKAYQRQDIMLSRPHAGEHVHEEALA